MKVQIKLQTKVQIKLIVLILLAPFLCVAKERLGELSVKNMVVNPAFQVSEPQHGEFSLGESSFALGWYKDAHLSGVIRFGSKSMINVPQIYEDSPDESFGVYEAYTQYQGIYGRVRAGLVPLSFGFEARMQEAELDFSRTLFFTQRWVAVRDFGLNYHISHNGYYTDVSAHNGESGDNLDGRVWYTASWGWSNNRNVDVGVSGQTGTTKAVATSSSTSTLGRFDVNSEALWRFGNHYIHWHPNNWDIRWQVFVGEKEQDKKIEQFHAGHFDLGYLLYPQLKLLSRYDYLDPNEKDSGDKVREISLGIAAMSLYQASTVYVIATKALEESANVNNDRLSFSWQISL